MWDQWAQTATYVCLAWFAYQYLVQPYLQAQQRQASAAAVHARLQTQEQQQQQRTGGGRKQRANLPPRPATGPGSKHNPRVPAATSASVIDKVSDAPSDAGPLDGASTPGSRMDGEEESIMHEGVQDYLAKAEQYKADLGDKRMTVEHLVLAMSEDPRFGEILSVTEGVDSDSLKKAVKKSRQMYNRGTEDDAVIDTTMLSKYARDLTAAAKEGKLDPVIGRNDELRRVINVLCRRTKNSPVLIGESGVGKTALVEGLAQRISDGDVPDSLRGCKLMALEMGMLMAGAMFPGEFEERMKGVLKELAADGGRALLFIDDIHTVTGPNAQQGGGVMDASILLKPLLSRGEIRCVGCTSADKFRKFIEKDPALERRFQQVPIEAPRLSETVSILRGLRHKYEAHHGVKISDAALMAAAQLSDRYLPDRHLPDKAIDLVDEASAKVKIDMSLKPEALDKMARRIRQLEGERRLLARAARLDRAAAEELSELEAEVSDLKAKMVAMEAAYEVESKESDRMQSLRDELERLNAEIEEAEEAGDGAKVDELKRAKREEVLRKLRLRQRNAKKAGAGASGKLVQGEVSEADIARIISKWTGIPLTKLVESEAGKVLHLEDELHQRIIGQHEAVTAVAEAIQRSRAGMKDPNGPIASFLFLGPTGVGKTELAKALAASLFNSEEAMVRLDMSEYMEKHAVAKLIGAPPGYVGYDEGGQLTEAVRRKPYTVVLFDEVEKAHVDVFNLLLQLLDDGRVTDSQGRVVSFKNAIIIMTSNLGSADIFNHTYKKGRQGAPASSAADGYSSELRELVMEKVRKHFQPEFINRIDEFIIFEPLVADQIATIVKLRTAGVANRLAEKKLKLQLGDSAIQLLASQGFDPVYGARPVKRAVQRELETPLAKALLTGQFQDDDTVFAEARPDGAGLCFSRLAAPVDPDDGFGAGDTSDASDADAGTPRAGGRRSGGSDRSGGRGGVSGNRGGAAGTAGAAAAGVPIPVVIPGERRVHHATGREAAKQPAAAAAEAPAGPSSGNAAGAASGADSGAGGASSSGGSVAGAVTGGPGLKFDPFGKKAGGAKGKKGGSGVAGSMGSSSSSANTAAADGTADGSAAASLAGGSRGEEAAAGASEGNGNVPAAGSANAVAGGAGGSAVDGSDGGWVESVAARLDADNLPSFLKTPRRRDEQDTLPTSTH